MEGDLITLSKWIPSWMILIDGQVKDSRGVWAYVEDGALWFRIRLGLHCTCTVKIFRGGRGRGGWIH